MYSEQRLNLVITGHIDHGKSTLIGRLLFETGSLQKGLINEIKGNLKGTGIKMELAHIMDYFEEERKQERTIDTTQFFFKTKKRGFAIIDTPGHKEFIKNMMTGSSLAQAAVLIISAKDGVQEQTKRHAYILNMLGIKNIILAINKMDLVGYSKSEFDKVVSDAGEIIRLLNIKQDNILPISAQKGDNIAVYSENMRWYKGLRLLDALDKIKPSTSSSIGSLRFMVQDVYNINGRIIACGKVASGIMKIGHSVNILPENIKSRIKTIEVFQKRIKKVYVGENIGITVENGVVLHRGQVICDVKLATVTQRLNANIFWISSKPFKIGEALSIKCGLAEESCRIESIEERINSSSLEVIERKSQNIGEAEAGKVTISVDRRIVVEDFYKLEELGRFILLRGDEVCAGGIIKTINYEEKE